MLLTRVIKVHTNIYYFFTFKMSPLWTKSTEICRSDVISKSGVTVTTSASVAFNDSNLAKASEVFP